MPRSVRGAVAGVLLGLAWGAAAQAVDSREWELSSVPDFVAGEFDGVILEAPGTLRVGYTHQETMLDASQVWSIVQDRRGVLYAGTGNEGRVYVIAPDGTESRFVELEGSQVYALALGADDAVFAATSPDGAIFKLTSDGEVEEWYRPDATYVWAMLVGADGALYAATGDPARLLKITKREQATVVYESAAPHFISLAQHPDGALLVGTDGTGLLLRVARDGTARVLYDAPLEEIRSILCTEDGQVYFVAVQSKPSSVSPTASVKLGGLTGETERKKDSTNGNNSGKQDDAPKPVRLSRRSGAAASVLYRMDQTDRVDLLWTGRGQRVYGAALFGGDILLGTDQKGTLIRLTPDGIPAVIYRGRAKEVVTVTPAPNGQLLLGTAETAAVIRLGPGAPKEAVYTSAVQDATGHARYGRVRWSTEGGRRSPALAVRTGNTQEPDADWGAWTPVSRSGAAAAIAPGRFLQVRMQWQDGSAGAAVTSLNIPFAPQNLPPRVLKIEFETTGRLESAPVNVGAESEGAVLQALLKRYQNGTGSKGKETEAPTHTSAIKVTWSALDPNEDTLEYAVHFRGVGEMLWKELETELSAAEYAWETSLVPDGWYELQVTASDRPSNATREAADATLVSERVLVDNTGPVMAKLRAGAGAGSGTARVSGEVTDGFLSLRRGRSSLDGQPWVWFAPADELFDSPSETFLLEYEGLTAGEHTVAIQVLDAALNIGSGKLVFTVK